jgi:hypothetical protein
MRFPVDMSVRVVRTWLIALLAGAGLVGAVPSAAQAAFGVESFFAANCKNATCTAESTGKNPSEFFTQAAGHPVAGVTDFTIKSHVIQTTPFDAVAPEGNVKSVRTDVAPGVSTNPEAVTKCSVASFKGTEEEPVPGLHAFTAPTCPESEIGSNIVHIVFEVAPGVFKNYVLEGKMYNLEQPEGLSSYFGIALSLEPVLGVPLYVHTFLEGHIEWGAEAQGTGKADYHDYYEIKNITPGLIESRVIFNGTAGNTGLGGFVTNPSNCAGVGPATTTRLHLETYEGESETVTHTGTAPTEGCNGAIPFLPVPFAPEFSLKPETSQSDQPDGVTTELKLPHDSSPTGIDTAQLKTASVTLPEGLTFNPSAAHGLGACTPKQIGIGTKNPVECPVDSKIGTVTLNVPDLPPEALQGSIYLGAPESGPITGPPYTMYIATESTRYDVSVRLKGSVVPNEATGRLTANFTENPEQPFSDLIMHFNGGSLAPLANPLACGTATTETTLAPFTGTPAQSPLSQFTVDSNGSGGSCTVPLPFSLTQTTTNQSSVAGAATSYTFNLSRSDGQQYLGQIKTVLPAGLVGPIPSVTLCSEAEANAGTCTAASQIGSAAVSAGAGSTPYLFTGGSVYLTGPYNGAPYGLSIVVPAVAGPFNLGNVVTRAAINVEPYTGRVVVTTTLPTIVKGIPLRIKGVTVAVNRQNFLRNPTNCGALATESTLTGFVPGTSQTATQSLSSPFAVTECNKLPFKPTLTAFTGAKTSRTNGASIEVKISQGSGQANIQQVLTTLPKQLPARLSTLKKACPAATFEVADPPGACSSEARVGGATATTPILPGELSGPAYLVSHGGEAYPDLDLILRGDGVTVILVGHTHITGNVISTKFESLPDVPVSNVVVKLPIGAHSVLAALGNVCTEKLTMPTTIVAQSGAKITQKTKITVNNCPVEVVGHRTSGTSATLTAQLPAAGRVSASGTDLRFVTRKLGKAGRTTITTSLTRTGAEVLGKFRQLRIKVRVGFVPKKGRATSKAFATVTFRA